MPVLSQVPRHEARRIDQALNTIKQSCGTALTLRLAHAVQRLSPPHTPHTALPISACGLRLDDSAVRVRGCGPSAGYQPQHSSFVSPWPTGWFHWFSHSLSCKRAFDRTERHPSSVLEFILYRAIVSANIPVTK
jgi:hypothetical protein